MTREKPTILTHHLARSSLRLSEVEESSTEQSEWWMSGLFVRQRTFLFYQFTSEKESQTPTSLYPEKRSLPVPRKAPSFARPYSSRNVTQDTGDSFSVLSTGIKEQRPNNSRLLVPSPHVSGLKNADYLKKKNFMIQGVFYLSNSEHSKITLRWYTADKY